MLIMEGEKLSIIDISTELPLNTSPKMRHKIPDNLSWYRLSLHQLYRDKIICTRLDNLLSAPASRRSTCSVLRQYWPFSFWPFQVRRCSPYRPLNLYDPFPFWRSQFIWKCSMTVCTRLYFHHRITITKCKNNMKHRRFLIHMKQVIMPKTVAAFL